MKAIIIGASGQIGYAYYQLLAEKGWNLVLISRSTLPYTIDSSIAVHVQTDRTNRQQFLKAIGEGADVLIDLLSYDESDALQLIDIQHTVNYLIVISSASVYADKKGRTLDEAEQQGFPQFEDKIHEDQTTVNPGTETYSTRKIGMETVIRNQSKVPFTILRPCAVYGAYSHHAREWWLVKRMLDQRPVIPISNQGKSRFHTTAASSIALTGWASLQQKQQQIINVGDANPLTVLEIAQTIADLLEFKGTLLPLEKQSDVWQEIGKTPWSVEYPFLLNTNRSEKLLAQQGISLPSYAEAIKNDLPQLLRQAATEKWEKAFPQLAAYSYPQFNYQTEDAFLYL